MGEDTAGAKTQPAQGTKCPKCLLYKLHPLQTPRCSHQHPSALRRLGSIHPKPITAHPRGADSTPGTRFPSAHGASEGFACSKPPPARSPLEPLRLSEMVW